MNKDRQAKLQASLQPVKRDSLIQDTSSRMAGVVFKPSKPKQIKKTEIFTERLTLALAPEQKDFIDAVAQGFQRKRTVKGEAINRNTIVRCLIELLREIKFSDADVANSEKELTELLRQRMKPFV